MAGNLLKDMKRITVGWAFDGRKLLIVAGSDNEDASAAEK